MMLLSILAGQLLSVFALGAAVLNVQQSAPEGCNVLRTDQEWPAPSVWKAALPGILARGVARDGLKHPDYRIEPTTVAEIQAAVRFAAKHRIRVSILNSGHDFLGRNDAPSGLTIFVGNLKGLRVLDSFSPTTTGVQGSSNATKPIPPQKQAYVTLGAGMPILQINRALMSWNLFALGAGHAEVSVAGGWGQAGGHSPLSPSYGLGADQFVEFKVITADGELRVANAASNPDLFWALKGGGGGTFGIVTEATVKAFPSPKLVVSLFYVNTTDIKDLKSIYAPLAYLHTALPDLVDVGVSGFYFGFPNAIKVFFLTITNSTVLPQRIIDPIAKKMAFFPGIRQFTSSQVLHWPYASYQAFFESSFGHGDEKSAPKERIARELGQELRRHFTLARRHGPGSGEMESADTQALGILPLDSILMDKDILMHPKLADALEASMPKGERAQLRGNLVSGKVVHQLGNDTSVNPAWRRAYCHLIATARGEESIGDIDMTPLKKLKADYGVYLNEASVNQTNWKVAFWGPHYEKLSAIKTKYDPSGLFWVSPGVNADKFHVKNGRVCRGSAQSLAGAAPAGDNRNIARGISWNADGPGFPFWTAPGGWTLSPVGTWKGAMGGNAKVPPGT